MGAVWTGFPPPPAPAETQVNGRRQKEALDRTCENEVYDVHYVAGGL